MQSSSYSSSLPGLERLAAPWPPLGNESFLPPVVTHTRPWSSSHHNHRHPLVIIIIPFHDNIIIPIMIITDLQGAPKNVCYRFEAKICFRSLIILSGVCFGFRILSLIHLGTLTIYNTHSEPEVPQKCRNCMQEHTIAN